MASEVQICNMALSHIGSDARVASISPPDGSVEAGHCATFYAQTRTELLEPGSWSFALARIALAEVDNPSTYWAYAYALPSDCLRVLRLISPFTNDDNLSESFQLEGQVLYTHSASAETIYVRDVIDTARFSPSFTSALSYLLAGYIAGPVIKGNEGIKIGDAMRQRAMSLADVSATAAANASSDTQTFPASSLTARA